MNLTPNLKSNSLLALSAFVLLLALILLKTFGAPKSKDNSLSPVAETPDLLSLPGGDWEAIEAQKSAWAQMLRDHQMYPPALGAKQDRKERKRAGYPDLAFNLQYIKTMDPVLGAVPQDRLFSASREVERMLKNRAPISGVTWNERGPNNVAGRVRACMFDPNDGTNKKFWTGSVGGGLWFTNDITSSTPVWNKINDFWDNLAVTSLAYNPANTQEMYAATGEGWFNIGSQNGGGIWKSTNGGTTWTLLAATTPGSYNSASDFHAIQKIVVKSNGTIFAATRGYYTNTGGIMRSTNGGSTWTKVLTVYTGAGTLYDWAADLEIASNGDVYCSFGVLSSGKVFKSTNANNGNAGSWTDLSSNIGVGNAQRIELACAPSNSSVVYAVAHGGSGANDIEWCKKTTNGGTTWSTLSIPKLVDDGTTHFTNGQAFYDLILAVHPTNADLVLAGGINLHRTTNGGTSWSPISHWQGQFSQPFVHADQHHIVFRPGASNEVVFLNDGGVFYSTNAGNSGVTPSFASRNNGLNVTQFYSVVTKNEVNSQYFLAGTQDNGVQRFTQPQINSTTEILIGDGGFTQIDADNSKIQVMSYIYNNLFRTTNGGITWSELSAESSGHFINPTDYDDNRNILYAAGNNNSLKRISGMDGSASITNLNLDFGNAKISAIKVSLYNDVVFLGIENARVYKLTNASTGSPSLTRIDNGSIPISSSGWVSSIDIGESDNHVMVTFSNYGVTSVWQTTNGGTQWYSKEGNLPDIPIHWALYNPWNRNQVLAATELGVWSTDNFGPTSNSVPVWGVSSTGLAYTRCAMLGYRYADGQVVVATHGRGLFTSDIFVGSPIADFLHSANVSCTGAVTVQFTDKSLKNNGTWQWDIDNNNTTDYTTQNPSHTYSVPGIYSVRLRTNNGTTTVTKHNLIHVLTSPPTTSNGCTLPANNNQNNNGGIGIFRFALGDLDHTTPNADGYYQDYACSQGTGLALNTAYTVTIQTGVFNNEGARLYIDYNDNGTFESGESAVTFPSNLEGTRTAMFTTPSSGVVTNKVLRARILSRFNGVPGHACDIGTYGQAEDYAVVFRCDRLVTVTTGSGDGSLRAAIACANSGDTVRISSTLAGQTINTGSTPIVINKNLVIQAEGSNISVTATGESIFDINPGHTVEFKTLYVQAGNPISSAVIRNDGILKLVNTNVYRHVSQMNTTLIRNDPGAQLQTFGLCLLQ